MMDFNELRDKAYKNACDKGFHDKEYSNEHWFMLIVTELSEAVEADRKGRFHFVKTFSNKKIDTEEWKQITGYEDSYEVSNLGNVRSKDMYIWNGKTYYLKKGRILKPGLSGTGYYTVSLKGKTHKVSRLVAKAFLCANNNSDCVNHIDGDKTNNNISNLEFISISQNNKHAFVTGLRNSNSHQKLSYEQKCEIAHLHKLGIAYTTIHKHNSYDVSESAIQRVCNEYVKYTDSVEFELADVMIRLLDFAGLKNIDLSEFNEFDFVTKQYGNLPVIDCLYGITRGVTTQMVPLRQMIKNTLFFTMAFAVHNNIDIKWHIAQKMKYNSLRPKMHGKAY